MFKKSMFVLMSVFLVLLVVGCSSNPQQLNSMLKVDNSKKTVTVDMIAGYNSNNDYINFDGYANGKMVVTIPVGYKVQVHFENKGGFPASLGVYDSNNKLAFKGAGESLSSILENPTPGVIPGDSTTYTFVVDKVGTYRMENLINRFPQFKNTQQSIGMWAKLKVVSSGNPSISIQ